MDSVKLLSWECTINAQKVIEIVEATFEKIEILNFSRSLFELPLILTVSLKWKKRMEIFSRRP